VKPRRREPEESVIRITARRPHLVVIGDLLVDIMATVGSAGLERGSDVPGTVRFRAGGSAANTSGTFAGLGGRATLVCSVGVDPWGRLLVRSLRGAAVVVRAVRSEAPTGRLVAIVEGDGERTFVTDRGAADGLRPDDVEERWFRGVDALHVPGYSIFSEPLASASLRAAGMARSAGAFVSVDLSSRGPLRQVGRARAREAVAALGVTVLFGNREEFEVLVGDRPEDLLDIVPVVVVKDGAVGCRVLARPARRSGPFIDLSVPTRAIRDVDTTGAGDAFDAGFLLALLVADGIPRSTRGRLRAAAQAGHRAARAALTGPRPELAGQ